MKRDNVIVSGIALLAFTLVLAGCAGLIGLIPATMPGKPVETAAAASSQDGAHDVAAGPVDVYVVGQERIDGIPIACLWKNGERAAPLGGAKDYAGATAIVVSGNDVYVAGTEKSATAGQWGISYWKNGQKVEITNGRTHAEASSIAVSGSDVYVAGWERSAAGPKVACYWKNGVKVALSDGKIDAEIVDIAIVGNDVYAAGYEVTGTQHQACYWKNGVKTALAGNGNVSGPATAIAVSGNDVYVAGHDITGACYWKNGVKVALPSGGSGNSANDITVSGRDVYAVGGAGYWKNGKEVVISDKKMVFFYAIAVWGNDVYIAGYEQEEKAPYNGTACYWKNGQKIMLTDGNTNARVSAIALSSAE